MKRGRAERPTRITARVAVVLAAAFLAILVLLHFLESKFDPSWRMISDYEIGNYGWMMTLAFFCWGMDTGQGAGKLRHSPPRATFDGRPTRCSHAAVLCFLLHDKPPRSSRRQTRDHYLSSTFLSTFFNIRPTRCL